MKKQVYAACPHDCPDACGVLITVETEGANSGRAVKIQGDPSHPVTRGFLCGKVAKYLDRVYSSERVLYPISREFSPEAVLPYSYGGTLGVLNNASMDHRFFHLLGASQLDRTICASAGGDALITVVG